MKQTDLAWAAGILDGEGTVLIDQQKPMYRNKSVGYHLRVTVGMIHRPSIEKFASFWKLHVAFHRAKKRCHNHTWRATCADVKAMNVLKDLKPYLVTKLDRATLGLKFRKETSQPVGSTGVIKRKAKLRLKYYKQMKK